VVTYEAIVERLESIKRCASSLADVLLELGELIDTIKQETSGDEPSPFDVTNK
jgi:hypothetical protein